VLERNRLLALDNGLLRIILDRAGLIRSIRDHRFRREVLASGGRGNVFQLHPDFPNNWDAWDVDVFYREACEDLSGIESMEVVENSPLRATVRIERRFGKSRIVQRISMCAASTRIDFDTEVDWQESNRFLKVAFPVNIRSPRATYEIQYGHVERPTHFNTTWDLARFEVCAQQWADLSEGDYGVALLNDCKYGYDIHGNVMRLSLLRAPGAPDPRADRGTHRFKYALLPHLGDFRRGLVLTQSHALNSPLQMVSAEPHPGPAPASQSFFQTDKLGVVIEAIKWAEREHAVIVRCYEAYGTRGPFTLLTSLKIKEAYTADLMERTLSPINVNGSSITLSAQPFEIITIKLLLA
jgi:alpha-mannosidase